jgi:hypothetical protein
MITVSPSLKRIWAKKFLALLLAPLLFLFLSGETQNISIPASPALGPGRAFPQAAGIPGEKASSRIFPSLYFTGAINKYRQDEDNKPYGVDPEPAPSSPQETETDMEMRNAGHDGGILKEDILAFYGHPLSERMGILGRYSITELDARLSALADEYRAVNGGREVRKAFYLIYGTVWPEGEIGILREPVLLEYIQYALERDILIFIDHQIGRYQPADAMRRMLPYLNYPNVHLALDPEWRTTKPMQEIGTVTGEELNQVQQIMEDYITENGLSGERLLVVHQFNWQMIKNREKVQADFKRVRLVHCADGFGNPSLKRASYAYNAQADNIPIKGFKLFYNFGIPGAGYDEPLLTPQQVVELKPRPSIIMYQ